MTTTGSNVAAPAVQALADEHGIDVTALTGTGPRGAVTIADVTATILKKNAILMQQTAAGFHPINLTRVTRDQTAAGASALRAPSAQRTDGDLSDQEAGTLLWRLGFRAGLKPPENKIAPTLPGAEPTGPQLVINPDGTGYWAPRVDL